MAAHSRILAWEIPWPGDLPKLGIELESIMSWQAGFFVCLFVLFLFLFFVLSLEPSEKSLMIYISV